MAFVRTFVMKVWPRNASASNRSCSDWESLNDCINCEEKQITRLSTWPEEVGGRAVEGEVTAFAEREAALWQILTFLRS